LPCALQRSYAGWGKDWRRSHRQSLDVTTVGVQCHEGGLSCAVPPLPRHPSPPARWVARLARAGLRGRRALQHGRPEYRARRALPGPAHHEPVRVASAEADAKRGSGLAFFPRPAQSLAPSAAPCALNARAGGAARLRTRRAGCAGKRPGSKRPAARGSTRAA
jgi:hypothetical protein